jgi:hypothetical protein
MKMAVTGYAEDLEAIDRYVRGFTPNSRPALTLAAKDLKDSWIRWYDGLSFLEKNGSKEKWLEGRERRRAFNVAMGMPEDPSGMTSEDVFPSGPPGSTLGGAVQAGSDAGKSLMPYIQWALVIGGLGVGYLYLSPFLNAPQKGRR